MKVAEALAERAALTKKIKSLRERARTAARYLEGEEPPESAVELLAEARMLLGSQARLITSINITNARTLLEPGVSLTQALADRDRLVLEISMINDVATEAGPVKDLYRSRRKTELPEKTDLDVKELRAQADRLSKEARDLDAKIQQANWVTELIV